MSLFPEITPFATHMLPVDGGHTLYVEQSGNPAGLPVIVLHGGPGTGCNEKHRRRFNPALYHIICFDQRGAGRSTPFGQLAANTTAHLVRDIETIRTNLGIEEWVVYGTSWGSTLALTYAQTEPQSVLGIITGGVFMGSEHEIAWFNTPSGLPRFRPTQFAAIQAIVQEVVSTPLSGNALDKALLNIFTGPDATLARRAAEAFVFYESSACDPNPNLELLRIDVATDEHLVTHAAIELHYFAHHCFLTPGQLMDNLPRIAHLPMYIVQGELDFVCPPATAIALHQALPGSQLTLVPMSGHRSDDGLEAARVAATNAMAQRLRP